MNSSTTSGTAGPLAPVQHTFNWIELFPLPIASSIMLTQPVTLLLLFGIQLLAPGSNAQPLDQLSITLFLLGSQWLALTIRYLIRRGLHTITANRLHFVGLLAALALLVGTHLFMLHDLLMLLISACLVTWFWKQGMDQTDTERGEERLTWFFRVGFFVMLILLVLTIIFQGQATMVVSAALPTALPLFFVSGLVGLSFSRLANIQREQARHGSSQSNALRNWTLGLVIAWIAIMALAFSLELFSFQAVQHLLLPILAFLANLVTWLILAVFQTITFVITAIWVALSFLLHLLGINPHAVPPPSTGLQSAPTPAPGGQPSPTGKTGNATGTILNVGRIVLSILALALLFVIVRLTRRRMYIHHASDGDDEERETLSVRAVLNERRQQRQQQTTTTTPALETLEPASARASYRAFLQAMANDLPARSRRLQETPDEYQKRLLATTQRIPQAAQPSDNTPETPTPTTILQELTQMYNRERYGSQPTNQQQRSFLQQWVPSLLQRLKRPTPL